MFEVSGSFRRFVSFYLNAFLNSHADQAWLQQAFTAGFYSMVTFKLHPPGRFMVERPGVVCVPAQ